MTAETPAWKVFQSFSPMATRAGTISPRAKGMTTTFANMVLQVTHLNNGTVSLTPLYSRAKVNTMRKIPSPPAAATILVRA